VKLISIYSPIHLTKVYCRRDWNAKIPFIYQ